MRSGSGGLGGAAAAAGEGVDIGGNRGWKEGGGYQSISFRDHKSIGTPTASAA